MKDMNAPEKKMALMNGWMFVCEESRRSQTVPMRKARPKLC
jgi:hypothetical protein